MTNQNTSPWTEQAVADLTRLHAEGYSCKRIGEKIGFGRNAVIGKIHRLGLEQPKKKLPIIRMGQEISAPNRSVKAEHNLRCVEIVPRHLTLMDLEPSDCRYPYGTGPYTFCGHPKQAGSSYCTPHFHLCREESKPLRSQARKFFGTDFARSA